MGDLCDGLARLRWKSSPPLPDPASFNDECLSAAEEAAGLVVDCVHPTRDSEESRRDAIDYIQRLIKTHLHCEVFTYGSVPLKTYLPDGDIDLTVLKVPNPEQESLAIDVLAVLQREEQNEGAEYQVKDTQFIDAEVKLVKCLVRNFIIDISFNQLGGLSTLCFLEQVDRIVGRNHLFKRSIMLVKTWCYHESRILGAHHGLISTYALETLVLYIFHLFHSSLTGPLMVLYRFLSYYSQFDWENCCVSLKGPVFKSSLPDIVAKMPENEWYNLLFTEEFLENCIDMFSVPLRRLDEKPKAFQAKHLNIIDPLREYNNLGRSVNKGNFYRIQSAFKYGARKLGQVLSGPRDKVAVGITDFFSNTLTRHNRQHTDIITQHLSQRFGDDEDSSTASNPSELFSDDELLLESSFSDFDDDSFGIKEKFTLFFKNDLEVHSVGEVSEEAYDTSSSKSSALLSGNQYHKHQYLSSKSSAENGSLQTGNFQRNSNTYKWCLENSHAIHVNGSDSSTCKASVSENVSSLDSGEMDSTSAGEPEASNPLADMSGDYDSHIRSLLYGQLCHGFTITSRNQNNKAWDIVRQSMPFVKNQFQISMGRNANSSANSALAATDFRAGAKRKPHGTGTYLPPVNGFYRETPQRRNRNRAPGYQNRYDRGNGLYPVNNDEKYSENDTHEFAPPQVDVECQSAAQSVCDEHQTNDLNSESRTVEFGTVGNLAQVVISGLANVRDSTMKQESEAVESVCLKNEEFPPLKSAAIECMKNL